VAVLTFNLPTDGTAVSVAALAARKTVAANGGVGQVDISSELTPTDPGWVTVGTIVNGGHVGLDATARWMRIRPGSVAPGNVDVSGNVAVNTFLNLPAPAGNGAGAGVDVSAVALGRTVVVGGDFQGVVSIEQSDDGNEWSAACPSFQGRGSASGLGPTTYLRVRRSGVPSGIPAGTPIVNVGGTDDGQVALAFNDPRNFGAVFDGVTDCTAAMQRAIDVSIAANGGKGAIIYLPGGTAKITATLNMEAAFGVTILGQGRFATVLSWAGPAAGPMFYMNRSDSWLFEQWSITCANGFTLDDAIICENGVASAGINSTWGGLRLFGFTGSSRIARCAYFRRAAGDNTKNDNMTFYGVRAGGYTDCAFMLEGRNAKSYDFIDCEFTGKGVARCGIDTTSRAASGAAFSWHSGNMLGHLVADFLLGDRNDTIYIEHCYSEDSYRFVERLDLGAGTASGVPQPLILMACRFALGPDTAPDGEVVRDEASGPLTIDSCKWGSEAVGSQARIYYAPNPGPGAFMFRGNYVDNDGDGIVFTGSLPSNWEIRTPANLPLYGVENWCTRGGIRQILGWGVEVPQDGPLLIYQPSIPSQWQRLDLQIPTDWYDAAAASPGPLPDLQTASTDAPLYAEPPVIVPPNPDSPIFQQVVAGWARTFAGLTNKNNQRFELNSGARDPATESVAWYVPAQVLATGGNRYLCALGTAGTAVGGGGLAGRITAAGLLQLLANGALDPGLSNYLDGLVHGFLFKLHHPTMTWKCFTDLEEVTGTYPAFILNSTGKGLGAHSGGNAITGMYGDPAIWTGDDVVAGIDKTTLEALGYVLPY
jgi:hypothetical protein